MAIDLLTAALASKLSHQGSSSSESTSSLPSVTSSDNGKVLTVENGNWAAADKSPLVVTYTITGQATDYVYPLSYSHTLAQIAAAQAAGREVLGYLVFNGIPVSAPAIVRAAASGKMDYSGIAYLGSSGWMSMQVDHYIDNNVEYAYLYLASINTTQITFDSTTGTLYVNNVPEAD